MNARTWSARPLRGSVVCGPARLVRARNRLAGAGAVGVRAPFEAVEEAVEALGRDPGLVLIFFPTGVLDPQEAATQAQAAAETHV